MSASEKDESFNKMLQGLEDEATQGYIHVVDMPGTRGNVRLYNYTRRATFKGRWNLYTCRARGLILDIPQKLIVACPFPKFFNYGELPKYNDSAIPKQSHFEAFPIGTMITEKMDGSLGILFWYEEKWWVSTRGSFTSSQAVWALEWLRTGGVLEKMVPGITYLCEIIYPGNKIVIDYGTEDLVLLGAYRSNGDEIIDLESLNTGLHIAPSFSFTGASQIEEVCKTLPSSKEGYVVRLPSGERCKFKGDAYNIAHKVRSGFTPELVWNNLLWCIPNPKEVLPEEFYDEYDQMEGDIIGKLRVILLHVTFLGTQYANRDRKDIALDSTLDQSEKMLIFLAKTPGWEVSYQRPNHKVRRTIFEIAKK